MPEDGRVGRTAGFLALDERLVLANQQFEMIAFFVCELEEDLLALGVFKPLAVALEEAMRPALAADADQKRLLVVHAGGEQLLGPIGEQTVGRAFEEEERRPRLELRITREQLTVPIFELAQVSVFVLSKLLEDRASSRIARNRRRARIELAPASFRRNRNAQRIAREQQFGDTAVDGGGLPAGPARLAFAVDLDHALTRPEVARCRDFLDESFDVGAEELGRLVAGLADQVKVTRVAVRMLEAEAAFAEIHLAGDARIDHPLERAIDRRAADALILAADDVHEVVGAEMSLLTEEYIEDQVALAGALASGWP